MNSDVAQKVYPCPFSKNYGIPVKQAWTLLKIFFAYRLLVAMLFVALYFTTRWVFALQTEISPLYLKVSGGYLLLIVSTGILMLGRYLSYTVQAQLAIFIDIVLLTLLMHACGGIHSGIGILLVISIAAGGMLVGGRCAFLFAAMASLAVLSEQTYSILNNGAAVSSLTYSGMLGASYFTIALLTVVMAQRTELSELLAHERQQTIIQLEELNQHIIQYMQSGILIIDPDNTIQLHNQAAAALLQNDDVDGQISAIEPFLNEALQRWREDKSADFSIVKLSGGQEVQVRFSALAVGETPLYLLILEDVALYNQQLQQSKLASLGRLTASMAHEIRNPLGAISHAAQLLSEADELLPQNKRLTEIIHRHTRRVNGIIESILQLSRRKISQKRLIQLAEWLPAFVEQLRDELQSDNIVCIKQGLDVARIMMDEGHLRQILHNLCVNALKYGDVAEAPVAVGVLLEADQIHIQVQNSGQPISEQSKQHLFEPFFTTSSSGTGLGLYISRELAELNRARLNYTYQDNKNIFTLSVINAQRPMLDL